MYCVFVGLHLRVRFCVCFQCFVVMKGLYNLQRPSEAASSTPSLSPVAYTIALVARHLYL
jgi:hypothetical protein